MVARRTVLGSLAGLALGATVGAAAAAGAAKSGHPLAVPRSGQPPRAPARPGDIPTTLAASRALREGRLQVLKASFPLTHLGVMWRGSRADARVLTDAGWTSWTRLTGCAGGPDGLGAAGGHALIVVAGAIGYEVVVDGSGPATITELNTIDGPARAAAAASAPSMPLPDGTHCLVPYLSRAAWGADESLRFTNGVETWPAEFYPVQALTVHHTAGANADPDPAATVRAIYYFQAVTEDWGDIGYNLLIDEGGKVYEGRFTGPDSSPVFGPDGPDGRALMGVGGHAFGYNTGNIGIAFLGNFQAAHPTPAARASLLKVLSSLVRLGRLGPEAIIQYVNPTNGNTKQVHSISGHRDWDATDCPGDLFYPTLAAIRRVVDRRKYRDLVGSLARPPAKN